MTGLEELERSYEDASQSSAVVLIPEKSDIDLNYIRTFVPVGNIIVCDFPVSRFRRQASTSTSFPGAYVGKDVINIDHHSGDSALESTRITSTSLAIQYVKEFGVPAGDWRIVLNHADTDGILAGLIMKGFLDSADVRFLNASLAADHTGEENEIADLLQALKPVRNVDFSIRELIALLRGDNLSGFTNDRIAKRKADRDRLKEMVARGNVQDFGRVKLLEVDHEIDAELTPALFNEPVVVMLTYPLHVNPDIWAVKLRAGVNIEPGFSLRQFSQLSTELGLNGRWNAHSNRRTGGTAIPPEEFARLIAQIINKKN